jgi:hypothetical protein
MYSQFNKRSEFNDPNNYPLNFNGLYERNNIMAMWIKMEGWKLKLFKDDDVWIVGTVHTRWCLCHALRRPLWDSRLPANNLVLCGDFRSSAKPNTRLRWLNEHFRLIPPVYLDVISCQCFLSTIFPKLWPSTLLTNTFCVDEWPCFWHTNHASMRAYEQPNSPSMATSACHSNNSSVKPAASWFDRPINVTPASLNQEVRVHTTERLGVKLRGSPGLTVDSRNVSSQNETSCTA